MDLGRGDFLLEARYSKTSPKEHLPSFANVRCFRKLGVLFVGVLIIRALLLGGYIRAPDFGSCQGSLMHLRDLRVFSINAKLSVGSKEGDLEATEHIRGVFMPVTN